MDEGLTARPARDAAIDALKLAATCCVAMIHMSGYGMEVFAVGSPDWLACDFWDSLCRFAVPVFLMCTGALMLSPERELTVKRVFTSYFLRMLWILMFWALMYRLFTSLGTWLVTGIRPSPGFLWEDIKATLLFNHHSHLYYLQILLLVYALLPVMRVFVRAADRKELRYAVAVWAVLGVALPFLMMFHPFDSLGSVAPQYALNLMWTSPGYVLLGWYMYSAEIKRGRLKWYIFSFAAGFLVIFAGTALSSAAAGELYSGYLDGMNLGPALMSCGIFGAFRILFAGRESSKAVTKLAGASFCVYLIHHFFVMIFRQLGADVTLMPPIIGIPLETAGVVLLSLAGWWVLSKIPFVNNYLITTGAKKHGKVC